LLQARAELLCELRDFFACEGLLEVETPLLASSTTTEPYLDHLSVLVAGVKNYLLSSPEFAMKRLLVQGSGSIFQICKAFRAEEEGRFHRSEFSMLDWYMLDWKLEQLMDQVERLLISIVPIAPASTSVQKKSYGECFQKIFLQNPHTINLESLKSLVAESIEVENLESFSKDECLHLLFSEKIEKSFEKNKITFIYDFQESQAALAEFYTDGYGEGVAKRFEVYAGGLELANAYQEETSTENLRERFQQDNRIRKSLGKEQGLIDEVFLTAMEKGIPIVFGNCFRN